MNLDKSSLVGIFLALGGILAGLLLEGGNLRQILQPTAAMIVFGGTFGAVMLQFPLPVVLHAIRRLGSVFSNPVNNPRTTIRRLVKFYRKRVGKALCPLTRICPGSTIHFSRSP